MAFDLATAVPVKKVGFDLSTARPVTTGNLADQIQGNAGAPISRTGKFVQGLRDPIDGVAQLLTNMLPKGVVDVGNNINNWIADKTGLVNRLPEGGVDQQVREGENAYQDRRTAAGESGFDAYRTLGNVASPVNLAAAAKLPQVASLAGRVVVGAGAGASSAALSPVANGDFAHEKLKQMAAGGVGGALVPLAGNALSRIVSPNNTRNANLNMLRDEGVNPTVGQMLGGRWNALEEKAQSIPILGDAIANARGKALSEFNNAAINRASGQVGAKVDGVGQSAVKDAGDALSNAYNTAIAKVQAVNLDPQFNTDLTQLTGMAQNLTPHLSDKFTKTLNDVVMRKVSPNGSILGPSYKQIDSELGNVASRFGKSSVASEQEFGDAVTQLQSLLRQQMIRSNPQVAQELHAADAGWANLVRVEGAAKSAKNAEGVFTPAQLNMAAQTADDSVRKRAVSRGTALMQDLGNAGQSVIGNKVPNSFTTDRALIAGGALGSYLVNPAIPAGLLGGAALYTTPGQNMLRAIVGSRPQIAQPIANNINRLSSLFVPAGAQIGVDANR